MATSPTVYARWRARLRTRRGLLKRAQAQRAYRHRKLEWYRTRSKRADKRELAAKWAKLAGEADALVARRTHQVDEAAKIVSRHRPQPLRLRAHKVATSMLGTMEHGGNNMGTEVLRIIRENGGAGPEPWCGDFQAFCYRHAGSKAVTRSWASVSLLGALVGVQRTTSPKCGDLVRFTFDHVGMYEKDNGDGTITTIEGNTGASGAVSDSTTGGDGVYRKHRAKSLVRDYRRILR